MNFRNLVPFFLIFLQISKNECSTIVKKQIGRLGPDDIIGDIVDAVTSRKNNFQTLEDRFCENHNYCGIEGCKTEDIIDTFLGEVRCCLECNPCFPAEARVSLESGESLIMSQLQTGHRAQTVTSDGNIRFSAVRAFLKKQPTVMNMYMSISTSFNKTIRLSGNHLIYARKTSCEKFHPVYADQLSSGNEVLIETSKILTPAKVINVSNSLMQGAYVPLTMEGNIMVDEVLASCYPSSNHDLAHLGMTPLQWFPKAIQWIMGVEEGLSVYVKMAEDIGQRILPFGHLF